MSSTTGRSDTPLRPLGVFYDTDRDRFCTSFGETAFSFRHRLADSPLFSLPRLALAAERMMQAGIGNRFNVRDGIYDPDKPYSNETDRPNSLSAFEELRDSALFIKLGNVSEADRDYGDLCQEVVADTEALLEHPILGGVTMVHLSMFIASPHVVTPYHIDHDANFLFQISGEKDIYLFDPHDRELLPTDEIERFYLGETNAARYREKFQPRGRCFRLVPGMGVHHPPLAPHWVRNGSDISISASIHICARDLDRRAHVYQMNRILRKARLHPRPPEQSPLLDSIKASSLELLGKSHPTSSRDLIYSGVDRLTNGLKRVRSVASKARNWAH
jgi:hypothetical protein